MTDDTVPVPLEEVRRAPLDEAQRLVLQRRAAENAQAAREADAKRRPNVDPIEAAQVLRAVQQLASEATGMSVDELLEAGANLPPPDDPLGPVELRRMVRAGVPALHRDNVLRPQDCDALTAVRQLLTPTDRSLLVLAGGLGTRKTGSACWMLSQHWGIFAKAKHLLKLAIEFPDRYQALSLARYVVLDDLGAEVLDERGHWRATFSDLFDDWYGSKARVVITCNLGPDEFKQRYGERVVDRIRERGEFVEVSGASVRVRK